MEPQQIEDWQAVVADNQLRFEIVDFRYKEAELLDGWQLRDWLDLLTDDIEYRMPVRSSRVQRGRD
jgi:3-phenylpropionate/trans-cinnamate dioxygenase beta subunit